MSSTEPKPADRKTTEQRPRGLSLINKISLLRYRPDKRDVNAALGRQGATK